MEKVVLRRATTSDKKYVNSLVEMINKVYLKSEGDIWIEGHNRISQERLTEVIQNKELLIAIHQNKICGCIHLEKMDQNHYKFKMLVTNPKFKGKGLGSLLVNFAEQQVKELGASTMQLELLVPTEFEHPDKVFLTNWYTRIGYEKVGEHDVDYVHQGISQFLKTPCKAVVYQKKIIS